MSSPVETEVKIPVALIETARGRVERIGARLVRPRHHEHNTLFDFEDGRLRAAGTVVRVRSTPGGGVLTFKGPKSVKDAVRSREEIETTVGDPAVIARVLSKLGLAPTFRYEKYREEWEWDGLQIVLDETPIGAFVEIEGAVERIRYAAAALGFDEAEFVPETYVDLFIAGGGKGDMLFDEDAPERRGTDG